MSSPPSYAFGDNTPPYYILVSQTPSASDSAGTGPTYKSFSHPIIQYHYADDVPNMLLPQSPHEQVLILDYDPNNMSAPIAQSLSPDISVVGVNITEAPAASSTIDDTPNPRSDNRIYVIETTAIPMDTALESGDSDSASALVSRFKQRNAVLRAALEYPEAGRQDGVPTNPSPAFSDPFRIQASDRRGVEADRSSACS